MRNQMKTPQRRSTAPLPVVTTPRELAELKEEAAKFDVDLNAFERAVNCSIHDYNYNLMSDADVALVRRIGGEIDANSARWRALNQPATDDQIAVEMAQMTHTLATAGNLNLTLLADALCATIAELKPGLFALLCGCRAVQSKYRFLSIANVVKEIKEAQHNAGRYGNALERFRLTDFEADLQEQIKRYEAREPERKADRRRKNLARSWMRKSKHQLVPGGLAVEDENGEENNDDGAST